MEHLCILLEGVPSLDVVVDRPVAVNGEEAEERRDVEACGEDAVTGESGRRKPPEGVADVEEGCI
jgi:hypothetical protein